MKAKTKLSGLMIAMIMTMALGSHGALFEHESRAVKTSLIELFSSEGCNSCPPAEEWFSRLKDKPGLWEDFVPVTFHVDYWDNLGWPDKFARKEYTARQYAYSAAWKSSSVYTPGFVCDGRESSLQLPTRSIEKPGVLRVKETEPGKFTVSFAGADSGKDWNFQMAVLGFEVISKVKAGENSGRTLVHDFVTLDFQEKRVKGMEANFEVKRPEGTGVSRLGLAVWVSRGGKLEPVQAVGGWWEP